MSGNGGDASACSCRVGRPHQLTDFLYRGARTDASRIRIAASSKGAEARQGDAGGARRQSTPFGVGATPGSIEAVDTSTRSLSQYKIWSRLTASSASIDLECWIQRPVGTAEAACAKTLLCFAMGMTTPISNDLRIRIVEARAQEAQSYEQLAERFGVGRATVSRILRLARETGSVEPAPHGGGAPRRVTEADQKVLGELLRTRSDATLEELRVALATHTGVEVSRSTMCRELHRLGVTRKKNRWWRESSARRRSGPDVRPSSRRYRPTTLSA